MLTWFGAMQEMVFETLKCSFSPLVTVIVVMKK